MGEKKQEMENMNILLVFWVFNVWGMYCAVFFFI
jgi:hypothetical protein